MKAKKASSFPLYFLLVSGLLFVSSILVFTQTLFAQEALPAQSESDQHLVPAPEVTRPAELQPQTTEEQSPAPQAPAAVQQTEQAFQPPQPPAVQQVPAPAVQPPVPSRRTGHDALQNYRIGRDLETRNRFDEANTYYNEAIRLCMDELNRNNASMDSYTILTWALLRQRRYSEVINWGDRALRANPNDYRIIETMGEAYFFLNNYEHSLIMLQRYVASVPRGDRASTAYFFMGEIFRNQRRFLHADIAYTTAVTLESNIFLWWYRLGMVREAAGEYAPAIEAYEKAIGLNPSYREAIEALERTKRLQAAAPRT